MTAAISLGPGGGDLSPIDYKSCLCTIWLTGSGTAGRGHLCPKLGAFLPVRLMTGVGRVRKVHFELELPRSGHHAIQRSTSPFHFRTNHARQLLGCKGDGPCPPEAGIPHQKLNKSQPEHLSGTIFLHEAKPLSFAPVLSNVNPPRLRAQTTCTHVFYQLNPRDSAEMRES